MADPETSRAAGTQDDGDAPAWSDPAARAAFGRALEAAFERHRPQGTARWNFEVAFAHLDEELGTARERGGGPEPPPAHPEPAPSGLRGWMDRLALDRLTAWVDRRAASTAERAAERALRDGYARTGVDQVVEALRFLGVRVAALEDAGSRRDEPVAGLPWQVPPPSLDPWLAPVARWMAGSTARGTLVHAECGDGRLVQALRAAGADALGVEPRGASALVAAAGGLPVEVCGAQAWLDAAAPRSLAGLVLSGVVDRLAVTDLVDLVDTATDRLVPGAPLVVLSSEPDAARRGWSAVATDLLPGRPLHPETWQLVLARAGYDEIGLLAHDPGEPAPGAYAVRARRPS